mmetsp:Transcript_3504/g.11449  ORF Transcript_3504/g.11449 Transcript_3504/m.11449 type:complete len:304 (-) Transcript_3504:569-1480(-)
MARAVRRSDWASASAARSTAIAGCSTKRARARWSSEGEDRMRSSKAWRASPSVPPSRPAARTAPGPVRCPWPAPAAPLLRRKADTTVARREPSSSAASPSDGVVDTRLARKRWATDASGETPPAPDKLASSAAASMASSLSSVARRERGRRRGAQATRSASGGDSHSSASRRSVSLRAPSKSSSCARRSAAKVGAWLCNGSSSGPVPTARQHLSASSGCRSAASRTPAREWSEDERRKAAACATATVGGSAANSDRRMRSAPGVRAPASRHTRAVASCSGTGCGAVGPTRLQWSASSRRAIAA